jgi:hypothetical protein
MKMSLPLFYVPSYERKFSIATDIKDKHNYKLDRLQHILHKFSRIALVICHLCKRVGGILTYYIAFGSSDKQKQLFITRFFMQAISWRCVFNRIYLWVIKVRIDHYES